MATLTASAAQANVPAKYAINGDITRVVSYTVAAALSAGDIIQMLKVPPGANVVAVSLYTDLFGGGNATITGVGDGGSANRYLGSASTSSSLAAALVIAGNGSGLGYSYSVEDTVDITIGTVTSASAVGKFTLRVTYTLDNA
jgi:hypothetical protein